jgi:glycosyltransferase domain-containing protein
MNCSIIIPTYNRPDCLRRLLVYYHRHAGDFSFVVADSSSKENKEINKESISSFPDLKILHLNDYPEHIFPWVKYADALKHVKSEYGLFCADDDFIVPSAIKECLDFIEKNPDYSVVRGIYFCHSLKKIKNGEARFDWVPVEYGGRSISFDNPSERLKTHLAAGHTSTFYGVHRTDTLRFIFDEVTKTTSHGRLGEIVLTALTLIRGKMKILPVFYASRGPATGSIEKIYHHRPYFFTSWSSLMKGDTYQREYERAVDCLAMNLGKQTGLNSDLSMKAAGDALKAYFSSLGMGRLYKIRMSALDVLKKFLSERHLKRLLNLYERTYYIQDGISKKGIKKECSIFLEKNDSRFFENLNQIKEAVMASRI